jgi:hypothetical protein
MTERTDEAIVAKMRSYLAGHPDVEKLMSELQVWLSTPGMAQTSTNSETGGLK